MEIIVFVGIPGAGKTTYFKANLFRKYAHVSRDIVGGSRMPHFLHACLATQMPFVFDNTNIKEIARARVLEMARGAGFKRTCYYFHTPLDLALARNARREGDERIPGHAIKNMFRELNVPHWNEMWDSIVCIQGNTGELVTWREDVLSVDEELPDKVVQVPPGYPNTTGPLRALAEPR